MQHRNQRNKSSRARRHANRDHLCQLCAQWQLDLYSLSSQLMGVDDERTGTTTHGSSNLLEECYAYTWAVYLNSISQLKSLINQFYKSSNVRKMRRDSVTLEDDDHVDIAKPEHVCTQKYGGYCRVDIYVTMKSSSVFGMKSYNIIHLYKRPLSPYSRTMFGPPSFH
jgi:hypothetical protein